MSVSIYYTASRAQLISATEQTAIARLIDQHSIEGQLEEYFRTGKGLNWESLCLYDKLEKGVIFEGATKLPDNSEDAIWVGLNHWCQLLSGLRHALPGASWSVHVDDHAIAWDEKLGEYDPSL